MCVGVWERKVDARHTYKQTYIHTCIRSVRGRAVRQTERYVGNMEVTETDRYRSSFSQIKITKKVTDENRYEVGRYEKNNNKGDACVTVACAGTDIICLLSDLIFFSFIRMLM